MLAVGPGLDYGYTMLMAVKVGRKHGYCVG